MKSSVTAGEQSNKWPGASLLMPSPDIFVARVVGPRAGTRMRVGPRADGPRTGTKVSTGSRVDGPRVETMLCAGPCREERSLPGGLADYGASLVGSHRAETLSSNVYVGGAFLGAELGPTCSGEASEVTSQDRQKMLLVGMED